MDESDRITSSVNFVHPILAWLAGSLALTVSTAFNNSTPCFAQAVKLPELGIGMPISLCSSLNIFINEGGGFIPSGTEKLKPIAWFAL